MGFFGPRKGINGKQMIVTGTGGTHKIFLLLIVSVFFLSACFFFCIFYKRKKKSQKRQSTPSNWLWKPLGTSRSDFMKNSQLKKNIYIYIKKKRQNKKITQKKKKPTQTFPISSYGDENL